MDPVWLIAAFALGFGLSLVGLPPMVGYLLAGFLLNVFNIEGGTFLEVISELGVTLLLFTIGLKLKIKDLVRPEVSAGALIQMAIISSVFGLALYLAGLSGKGIFEGFGIREAALVAFALSFSSTVFAVKVLEERAESKSLHGISAIGILVIQDIIAVIFIVASSGKLPSIWVLALPLLLFLIRPAVFYILDRIGHGELLVLFGFFLALVPGAELFSIMGLKPDLGALVMGILVAGHPKSREMAITLLSFKDLFLIGFFLTIGLTVDLSWELIIMALFFALAINFKVISNFLVLTRFGLRARTSYFTALSLANYSEFGLIVASIAVDQKMLNHDWLGIIAVALSISFLISSPLNSYSHTIYSRLKSFLLKFETRHRLLYDRTIDIGDAEILIFGMGTLGLSTYDHLIEVHGQKVLGLDYNMERVAALRKEGKNVIKDDATDLEFWEMVEGMEKEKKQVKLVVLCLEDHKAHLFAIEKLKSINYSGRVVATAQHDDEVDELRRLGIDSAFNLYSEAGIGLADHVFENIG